ncbi:MAG: 16S rRNA (cytidine(1402)-2'-O)-methyltransferase [Acidobacteria bacterium]|nr:MAG: 16S rRNA (cytidine(1402)-2'-O)-methyltransferase [Acidobacteriota bacterium]
MTSSAKPGTLRVVATPIGNLGDLSPRAVEALREAEAVVAEDTRRTRKLLARLGLSRPLLSAHRFSEARRTGELVARLERGENLALVTDGGTPGISDPGARLVAAAAAAGCRVEPIPGPSAVTAALSASGFSADRFLFAGFLPSKRAARRRALRDLARFPDTIVLYEAPHRIVEALGDAAEILGARPACLGRELTKLHEEILRGSLPELHAALEARGRIRGEFVLVVGPAAGGDSPPADPELVTSLREALEHEEDDLGRAVARLARRLGATRAEVRRRLRALFE